MLFAAVFSIPRRCSFAIRSDETIFGTKRHSNDSNDSNEMTTVAYGLRIDIVLHRYTKTFNESKPLNSQTPSADYLHASIPPKMMHERNAIRD